MKKRNLNLLAYTIFTLAFAEVIGLGLASFFNSLDFAPHYKHPIFSPFCETIALCCFLAFLVLFFVNLALADKFNYKGKIWVIQIVCIFLLIIPFIYLNDALLDYIHKIFASPECWDFNKYH